MTAYGDVTRALLDWIGTVLDEIATTHDYPELADFGPFPDASVDFRQIRTVEGGSSRMSTAHARRKEYEATISILLDPEPFDESSKQSFDFADRLIASQNADRTLGLAQHGVPLDSQPLIIDLPGIGARPDGQHAREVVVSVTVTVPA